MMPEEKKPEEKEESRARTKFLTTASMPMGSLALNDLVNRTISRKRPPIIVIAPPI